MDTVKTYTIGRKYIYEWTGFGYVYPKHFPAHKVILSNDPQKNIFVFHGEMGWILQAPEGRFYTTNGKRPVGFDTRQQAIKHYLNKISYREVQQ